MRDPFCSCGTRADIRQLTTDFPKKLLVALSVVVILAMCLRPAEAATLRPAGAAEHKGARPNESLATATKDKMPHKSNPHGGEHRRRHQARNGTAKEHDAVKKINYEKARIKIERKMAYTRDNFEPRRIALKPAEDFGTGMPTWVPRINFVDIHFHKYGKTEKSKKIFEFIIRKLYKSLLDFYVLFQRFNHVKAKNPDYETLRYDEKRKKAFNSTIHDMYSAIEDIKDVMIGVNVTRWERIRANTTNLDNIDLLVDPAQYLKDDDILFRAYGNLLENWYLEFNCSKFRKSKTRKVMASRCKKYEDELSAKRRRRRNKRRKNFPSIQ